ncbi:hypothetical protein [Kibdelosporangium phytohabitans]|uniref:Uncharacterized protein n=1 Tax=Kibdelosporangium phytohabitans TaxID=860235 RepID=A0A0N9IDL6_9PSEU|nr:hypothetical protein [Kibdelosporangium phytohabitans]ALG14548.1 hypothetical protein AOZ06_04570 [Kibdelosporangium phytohabitans]MBE1467409.1 hypothetical protein [Kibdelosporangium phytohabitans]
MLRQRWPRALLLALPGLMLAGFGAVHPAPLEATNAEWWTTIHVLLLPVFPLLAVAQWILLTPAHPLLRWAGRLASFGFAAFYTGLDAVAGIAAGTVTTHEHAVTPITGSVFTIGDMLGYIGASCFLAANLCITADTTYRAGWRALPGGLILLAASVSFIDSHIFWPRGVLTMLAVAVSMLLLALHMDPPPIDNPARTTRGTSRRSTPPG